MNSFTLNTLSNFQRLIFLISFSFFSHFVTCTSYISTNIWLACGIVNLNRFMNQTHSQLLKILSWMTNWIFRVAIDNCQDIIIWNFYYHYFCQFDILMTLQSLGKFKDVRLKRVCLTPSVSEGFLRLVFHVLSGTCGIWQTRTKWSFFGNLYHQICLCYNCIVEVKSCHRNSLAYRSSFTVRLPWTNVFHVKKIKSTNSKHALSNPTKNDHTQCKYAHHPYCPLFKIRMRCGALFACGLC